LSVRKGMGVSLSGRRQGALVFTLQNGRAHTTVVRIGHRNSRIAEVLAGLSEGDQIVLHPSDRITGGVRISSRTSS